MIISYSIWIKLDEIIKDRIEVKDNKTWTCLIDIDKLIQDTEDTFINQLEGGDRKKAIKRLRYENCQNNSFRKEIPT